MHESLLPEEQTAEAVVPDSGHRADLAVQTTAPGSGAAQKSRLTLVVFQSVEQWFAPDQVPVGRGEVRNQREPSSPSLQGVLLVKASQHVRLFSSAEPTPDLSPHQGLKTPWWDRGINPAWD